MAASQDYVPARHEASTYFMSMGSATKHDKLFTAAITDDIIAEEQSEV